MFFRRETSYKSKLKKLAVHGARRRTCHSIEAVKGSAPTIGQQLLSDINQFFMTLRVTKLRTVRLTELLCAEPSKPWATYCNGKGITARTLNAILDDEFCLHSKDIRFNRRIFKGFRAQAIAEAQQKLGQT